MRQIIIDFGTLDLFGHTISLRIFGYGLMLVFGFLLGIYLAWRRARRCGENPDAIFAMGGLALLGGVLGARIAYVIQHWDTQFANSGNILAEFLNITSGGLIYYGGLILAAILVFAYLLSKRLPIRRYLDIVAVSIMVGLAFGRAGCLLNGCCYGGTCSSQWALSQEFPMYSKPLIKIDQRENPFSESQESPSPVYQDQLSDGLVEPDEHLVNKPLELVYSVSEDPLTPLIPPRELHGKLTADQLAFLDRTPEETCTLFQKAAGEDALLSEKEWNAELSDPEGLLSGSEHWSEAKSFQKQVDDGKLTFEDFLGYQQYRRGWTIKRFDENDDKTLNTAQRQAANEWFQADEIAIASQSHAIAVRPAQTLGIINALLIAILLTFFFRIRRREGQVFALLLMMYPISRFVLESIRDDNPHNLLKGILTHNQYTSLAMFVGGVILMLILQKMNPSAGPTWGERIAQKKQS